MFSNLRPLFTERLVLKKITETDARDMYEYSSDPVTSRFLLWDPHPSLGFTRKYIRFIERDYRRGRFFDWGINLRDTGKMIGTCGFTDISLRHRKAEVGYVLNPAYWHKGYASEALSAVIGFGFDTLGLERLEAMYVEGNTASRTVMERCGMTFEGIRRNYLRVRGEQKDVGVCAILCSEYKNNIRKE